MSRLLFPLLIALTALSCNLSDNVTFPGKGDNSNNPTDTGEGDVGPDTTPDEDVSEGAPVSFELTAVTVGGEELPATFEAATDDLDVEATFSITNSEACADCNVQLLVAFNDNAPVCLYDGAAGEDLTGSAALPTLTEGGEAQVHVHAVEADDCEAAIALGSIEASDAVGTVTFTPARLRVVSVTPTDEATDVVATTVRVGFNGAIDEASIGDLVRLEQDGTVVETTATTDANGVVLTPTEPLTEWQTEYTVIVEPGLTGGDRELLDGFTSTFQTRMFVPGQYYEIFPASQDQFALAYSNNRILVAQRGDNDNDVRFQFRFIRPSGKTGWIAYNQPSSILALTVDDQGGDELAMLQVNPASPLDTQLWHFIRQENGSFWIRNESLGDDVSLQSPDLTIAPATPVMDPTLTDEVDEELQDWSFQRVTP